MSNATTIAAAITQRWSVGLAIKRLLARGSIPEVVMHRCVLEKHVFRLFVIGGRAQNSLVVVARPDKHLQKKPKTGCFAIVWRGRH